MYLGNFFVILAISISKTSFALTLLGLAVRKWHFVLLWFSIISVSLVMGADAILQFTQCSPVEKVWNAKVAGTCVEPHSVIYYSMFAGGKSLFALLTH